MAAESLPSPVLGQGNSEHGLEPCTYIPLSKGQIRVLELSPANQETDQLRGNLRVKSLDELPPRRKHFSSDVTEPIDPSKHFCFEAISYVWGEASFTQILVTSKGFIRITPSLASILRRLRHREEPRFYWADGICINQNDISEKEIQIPLMGVIYGSAVCVLCDICEENEDLFLDPMRRYWKKNIRRGFKLNQGHSMTLSKETTAAIMGVQLPTQEESDEIEAFKTGEWTEWFIKFISSPWFHRLWIFQEFVLGRDVTMIFGHRHVPWGELYASIVPYPGAGIPWDSMEIIKPENMTKLTSLNSMFLIRAYRVIDPNTAHGREFMKVASILLGHADMSQGQFPMFLVAGCFKQCTIPRDRYFAILGLVDEVSDGKAHELHVDYTSPIRDIAIRFWKRALQLHSGGELVLIAGLAGRSEGYPSWLRDLAVPNPLNSVWQFGPQSNPWHKAGGDLNTWSATFNNDDPDQMITKGFMVDSIAEVSSIKQVEVIELEAIIIWFEQAITFFTSGHQTNGSDTDIQYSFTGEPTQDAAIKTVCDFNAQDGRGDTFAAIQQLGQSILSTFASYPDRNEDKMKALGDVIGDDEAVFKELFTQVYSMRGLRLFKSEKGMFAMLPKEVRKGDSVWVLKGCRLPAILRPSLAFAGSFELVGWGHVYGIMNGEAMQMPVFHWGEVSLR
ncbi:hypothetical protein FSHL1_012438 [Fusarium sambucinum]